MHKLLLLFSALMFAFHLPAWSQVEETVQHSSIGANSPTGVTFHTSDPTLQHLFDSAESKEAGNIVQVTPTLKVLVEGGGYNNVWIETQPMGGEMYAKRDLKVALNNQLVFIQGQRGDGRLQLRGQSRLVIPMAHGQWPAAVAPPGLRRFRPLDHSL